MQKALNSLKKILLPREYTFWIFAGFFCFFFFFNNSQHDLIHMPKIFAEACIVIYSALYILLNRNFDCESVKRDSSLKIIAIFALLYVFWITLTNTVFSSMPSYTLLGYNDWFSGYFLYTMCISFFLLIAFSRKLSSFNTAVQLSFWLSIVSSVMCLLEYLGFDVLLSSPLLQRAMDYKFLPDTATFPVLAVGNSGYIAALWLFLLPLPILLVNQNKTAQAYLWWIVLSIGLSSTHSKIAILVAVLFFVVYAIVCFVKRNLFAVTISLLSLCISLFGSQAIQHTNNFLYAHNVVHRNLQQTFNVAKSFNDRVYIWEGAFNAWKKKPVAGWGLETLQNNYFDFVPQSTIDYYGEIYAAKKKNESVAHFENLLVITPKDGKKRILREVYTYNVKPHNYFLEELYSDGIVGLVLLVLFLSLAARYCIISGSRESKVLLLGFGMYLIYLCGWFITIAVSPLAFILLGFAVHLAAKKRAEDRQALLNVEAPAMPDTA